MISVAEAIQIVRQQTTTVPTENVSIDRALGRVLAEDVVADTDLPPFDRAQMDGYAVRAQDVKEAPARLKIAGESAAGRGWHHLPRRRRGAAALEGRRRRRSRRARAFPQGALPVVAQDGA